MTIKDTIRKYSLELKHITHIPAKEVEILMCYLLNKNTIYLHMNFNKEFLKQKQLKKMIEKRANNYPLEYITNKVSFYGEMFTIKEGVLIPRPETEILVEHVIKLLKNKNHTTRILEIGTGCGIISIMLALLIKNIKIVAVDINEKALILAKENAIKHKVFDKIEFRYSNLYENIKKNENFDIAISNPPYISNKYKLPLNVKFEPSNALFGGEKGDEILKKIINETHSRNIQFLLCEMGYEQKQVLKGYFKNFNIKEYNFYKDYENFDRGFIINFNNKIGEQ